MAWTLTATASLQRLKAWFNNHSGTRNRSANPVAKIRTSRKSPKDQIRTRLAGGDSDRPKQKLQPKQAYSVLHWNDGKCLKTLIDSEWKKKLEDEPDLAAKDYLAYRNLRLDQLLAEETQDVKDDVERYRNVKDDSAPTIDPLLEPHEEDLPEAQRDEIVRYRSVQR